MNLQCKGYYKDLEEKELSQVFTYSSFCHPRQVLVSFPLRFLRPFFWYVASVHNSESGLIVILAGHILSLAILSNSFLDVDVVTQLFYSDSSNDDFQTRTFHARVLFHFDSFCTSFST